MLKRFLLLLKWFSHIAIQCTACIQLLMNSLVCQRMLIIEQFTVFQLIQLDIGLFQSGLLSFFKWFYYFTSWWYHNDLSVTISHRTFGDYVRLHITFDAIFFSFQFLIQLTTILTCTVYTQYCSLAKYCRSIQVNVGCFYFTHSSTPNDISLFYDKIFYQIDKMS